MTIFLLFLAGGLGSLARYGSNLLLQAFVPGGLAGATTIVNVVGCLFFGAAMGYARQGVLPPQWAPVVTVGFLGAFTTYSTFAAESVALWRDETALKALLFILLQNALGLVAIVAGLRLAPDPH